MENDSCKACGHHGLVHQTHGYASGVFCDKCRNGFYTVHSTDTEIPAYLMTLEGFDSKNKSHIAFVATLCNVNYLTAQAMISESKKILIRGSALKIKAVMSQAERLALSFKSPFAVFNQCDAIKSDFEDLSHYSYYLDKPIDVIYNVGWLSECGMYFKGHCSPEVIEKLKAVFFGSEQADFAFNRIRGNAPCIICGERLEIALQDREVPLGFRELLIPSVNNGQFYAAPALIIHYIEEHGYRPPDEFIASVMALDVDRDFDAQRQFEALRLTYS